MRPVSVRSKIDLIIVRSAGLWEAYTVSLDSRQVMLYKLEVCDSRL